MLSKMIYNFAYLKHVTTSHNSASIQNVERILDNCGLSYVFNNPQSVSIKLVNNPGRKYDKRSILPKQDIRCWEEFKIIRKILKYIP